MTRGKPDHQDADLILKLYDLRREAVMRESRRTIAAWLPKSFEDVKAIAQLAHPDNAAWRQVSSYFEMAYGFARHGILHSDLLAENAGEGLFLFAKIEPYLESYRKELSPLAFRNAEWLVQSSASARERMELPQARRGHAGLS